MRVQFEAPWDWLLVERVAGLVMGTLTDVEAEVVTGPVVTEPQGVSNVAVDSIALVSLAGIPAVL